MLLRTMSLVIAILCAGLTTAQTQTYPDRPVRVSVGFAAGSGPDIQARTVSLALGNSLGQQFYVENRLGANGTIAARGRAVQARRLFFAVFQLIDHLDTLHLQEPRL